MTLNPAKVSKETPFADLLLIRAMIWGINKAAFTKRLKENPYCIKLSANDMLHLIIVYLANYKHLCAKSHLG